MNKERTDLNREEAREYRENRHKQAIAGGYRLVDCVLSVGSRRIDVAPDGPGPRFAIITFAREQAAKGATYGDVLGSIVRKGDGKPYKIREADLLGYVCANEYCELKAPA